MPKCKHRTLIFFSGLTWLAIGIFLLSLGIHLILISLHNPLRGYLSGNFSLLRMASHVVGDAHQCVIVLLTVALLGGFLKGRYVLVRAVNRQVKRIESLPNPAPLNFLYSKGYYLLILTMILLGISLRFMPITFDTRGTIDAAIGAALINGATLFFRAIRTVTIKENR